MFSLALAVYIFYSLTFFSTLTAAKCFTCMDKDRCPKLKTIFEKDLDTLLYDRDANQTFRECSVTCPPGPKSCAVCRDKSDIIIFCSDDIKGIEVEASDGGRPIDNISAVCTYETFISAVLWSFAGQNI